MGPMIWGSWLTSGLLARGRAAGYRNLDELLPRLRPVMPRRRKAVVEDSDLGYATRDGAGEGRDEIGLRPYEAGVFG